VYGSEVGVGLAPLTVKKITEVLHRALEMAVRSNFLVRNPPNNADKPAVPRRELPTLGPDELNRLLNSATSGPERTDVPA
jgi:hypothetical protein